MLDRSVKFGFFSHWRIATAIVVPLVIILMCGICMDCRWEKASFIKDVKNDYFDKIDFKFRELDYGTRDSKDGLGNYSFIWKICVNDKIYEMFKRLEDPMQNKYGYKYMIETFPDNVVRITSLAIKHDKLHYSAYNSDWDILSIVAFMFSIGYILYSLISGTKSLIDLILSRRSNQSLKGRM